MKLAHDPLRISEVVDFLDSVFPTITYQKISEVTNQQLDAAWRTWLTNSSYNKIDGLDQLKYSSFIPGTTDAFGEFLVRYPERRIRVSRSDFVLTKILAKQYNRNILSLEEAPLDSNDCLVMSFPFSGNGSTYPDVNHILDQAEENNVPVFIDGAYFGISHGIHYPLDRSCIKDFAVSLSKNLAGNPLRLGIRFTRDYVDDGVTAGLIGSDIFDRLNAYLSLQLLEKYPHNWLIDKYRTVSESICKDLGLGTTNTLSLAIGSNSMTEFQRGDYIRVSISEELFKAT